MADVRHNLRLGHFVGRFHRDDVSAGFLHSRIAFSVRPWPRRDQRSRPLQHHEDKQRSRRSSARDTRSKLSGANHRQELPGIQTGQWKARRYAEAAFAHWIGCALFLPQFLRGRRSKPLDGQPKDPLRLSNFRHYFSRLCFSLIGAFMGSHLIDPVSLAIVMLMQSDLVISSQQRLLRVFRGLFDGFAGKIDKDLPLAPTNALDPLR